MILSHPMGSAEGYAGGFTEADGDLEEGRSLNGCLIEFLI